MVVWITGILIEFVLVAGMYDSDPTLEDVNQISGLRTNPDKSGKGDSFSVGDGLAERMVRMLNEYRKASSMEALVKNRILAKVAHEQVHYMCKNKLLTHSSPEGSLQEKVRRLGFRDVNVGQNIAKQENSDYVELGKAWFGSEEHRKNILGDFIYTEVATCQDSDGSRYWAQIFGKDVANEDFSNVETARKLKRFLNSNMPAAENERYVILLKPGAGHNDAADTGSHATERMTSMPFDGFHSISKKTREVLEKDINQLIKATYNQSTASAAGTNNADQNQTSRDAEDREPPLTKKQPSLFDYTNEEDRDGSATLKHPYSNTTEPFKIIYSSRKYMPNTASASDTYTSHLPESVSTVTIHIQGPETVYKTTTDFVYKTLTLAPEYALSGQPSSVNWPQATGTKSTFVSSLHTSNDNYRPDNTGSSVSSLPQSIATVDTHAQVRETTQKPKSLSSSNALQMPEKEFTAASRNTINSTISIDFLTELFRDILIKPSTSSAIASAMVKGGTSTTHRQSIPSTVQTASPINQEAELIKALQRLTDALSPIHEISRANCKCEDSDQYDCCPKPGNNSRGTRNGSSVKARHEPRQSTMRGTAANIEPEQNNSTITPRAENTDGLIPDSDSLPWVSSEKPDYPNSSRTKHKHASKSASRSTISQAVKTSSSSDPSFEGVSLPGRSQKFRRISTSSGYSHIQSDRDPSDANSATQLYPSAVSQTIPIVNNGAGIAASQNNSIEPIIRKEDVISALQKLMNDNEFSIRFLKDRGGSRMPSGGTIEIAKALLDTNN